MPLNDWTWLPTPEEYQDVEGVTYLQHKDGFFLLCFSSNTGAWRVSVINPITVAILNTLRFQASDLESLIKALEKSSRSWNSHVYKWHDSYNDWHFEQTNWSGPMKDRTPRDNDFKGMLMHKPTRTKFRVHQSGITNCYYNEDEKDQTITLESLILSLYPYLSKTDWGRVATRQLDPPDLVASLAATNGHP